MAKRTPKEVKPVELKMPDFPSTPIDRWIVFGLDPSLSRTGFAVMQVERSAGNEKSLAFWLEAGSFKPADSSDPVWVRSKAVALAARDQLQIIVDRLSTEGMNLERTGLIISFEAPTPQNDFLTSISRILHLVLFEEGSPAHRFARAHVQMTNASTLRSLMGLKMRGAKNKTENVALAYTFLPQGQFPNLDTDACDAVLMSMMARYTAAILLGYERTIPERFLIALCNAAVEIKGTGRNARPRTKGILHRPEYWSLYERRKYDVLLRDARTKKPRLDRFVYTI